jgi:hypothetical protein
MTDLRLTSEATEALIVGSPELRSAANSTEVLVLGSPFARLAAEYTEVLVLGSPALRAAAFYTEVLYPSVAPYTPPPTDRFVGWGIPMRGTGYVSTPPVPPDDGGSGSGGSDVDGWAFLFEDQFGTFDTSKWGKTTGTFGAPDRIQYYRPENVTVGTGSAGATGGTSMKMLSKRENYGGRNFTAGMIASKNVNYYLPRYCRIEMRQKIPHGQGVWPAEWLTAKSGGADMVEIDIMEYFHAQIPGRLLCTLHRKNNAGTTQYNVHKNFGGTFFENPTTTPGWHTIVFEVYPESGSPTAPNTNVRMKAYLNGTLMWNYLDTQALYWTTNGGSDSSFYNLYLQGSQIDGRYVGHPDGPLGYDHIRDACIIGGTKPSSCTTVKNGINVIYPTFGDPSSTYEIDYIKVWKYTGT